MTLFLCIICPTELYENYTKFLWKATYNLQDSSKKWDAQYICTLFNYFLWTTLYIPSYLADFTSWPTASQPLCLLYHLKKYLSQATEAELSQIKSLVKKPEFLLPGSWHSNLTSIPSLDSSSSRPEYCQLSPLSLYILVRSESYPLKTFTKSIILSPMKRQANFNNIYSPSFQLIVFHFLWKVHEILQSLSSWSIIGT